MNTPTMPEAPPPRLYPRSGTVATVRIQGLRSVLMPRPPEARLVEIVEELRDLLGVSRPQLASLAGFNRAYLWRVLSGGSRTPTPEVLGACLIALGKLLQARDRATRRAVAELLDDPDDEGRHGNGDAA